ncbi:hypothetical protein FQR65_LT13008 [Abscondita terminalis]|nr:hypothetical protein FQR65_LT13008 [Abscondita terminalis]
MIKLPQEVINKIEEHVQNVINICNNTAPNDDPLPSLQNDTFEMRESGKCIFACVFKKEGFLDENGTIDHSGAKKAVKRFTLKENLDEYDDELVKVVELCTDNSFQIDDECETSNLMQTCMSKKTQPSEPEESFWTTIYNWLSNVLNTIINAIVN